MKKRVLVFWIVSIVLIAISGGLGYITAYVQGLLKVNDMHVRTYCHVLLLESLTLSREVDSSGTAGLINAAEQNCGSWASFIRVNEPYCSPDTKIRIAEALEAWEKAKRNLEEIRSLHVK